MGQTTALTSCPLDCPDTCSLTVTLDQGRVIKIDGDHRNPVTEGYICKKVRAFDRHVYGPDRLTRPAVRKGPKGSAEFEEVSWTEALDLIADRMTTVRDQHGGQAILPFSYGGSNGLLTQNSLDERLFRRLGSLRLAHTVCAAPSGEATMALYGKMAGVAYDDYPEAQMIVVWGANPSASGIHLVPQIRRATQNGARLVVVDPRATPLAKQADLHLALRPGTDLALALAIIRALFHGGHSDRGFLDRHTTGAAELERKAEEWTVERAADICGLDASAIDQFIEWYAAASPAVIRCGWGQERNRNGGSATAAILAIPAVAGKFGVRGGGYTASNSAIWKRLGGEMLIGEPEQTTREVNMNRLGRELLRREDPIRLLFVYNSNPMATLPRQDLVRRGLEREDLFTVVFDQVLTDTARFADVVLPATTFLEHRDLRPAYGAFTFQTVEPVIEPVGEAKPNGEVFELLIQRLGLGKDTDLPFGQHFDAVLQQDELSGEQREHIQDHGTTAPAGGARPVQFVDVFPNTEDRKAHLFPEALDRQSPLGLYGYAADPTTEASPLTVISPATRHTVSSSLGQLWKGQGLEMHPADAEARELKSGDSVRIFNEHGEVRVSLTVTRDVRPGVVFLPKGLWLKHTDNGWTSNVLAPDTYTDLGDGACFNDTRAQVEKA